MIMSPKIVEAEGDLEGCGFCYDGCRPVEDESPPKRTAMIIHTVSYLRFHSAPWRTERDATALPPTAAVRRPVSGQRSAL